MSASAAGGTASLGGGFPRLNSATMVVGFPDGINGHMFMTNSSFQIGGEGWASPVLLTQDMHYLHSTLIFKSDTWKELVRCPAVQQSYDHTHSWD